MELHTEGIDNSDLTLVLTFKTFKDKDGTVQVLGDADDKLISTVCTGTCATGNTAQSVIDATCKELESGPEWVDKDEKILTEETVDTMWKEECQSCEDIKDKDPGSRFNWTCTLKVLKIVIALHPPGTWVSSSSEESVL